jgi:hypothetical protein
MGWAYLGSYCYNLLLACVRCFGWAYLRSYLGAWELNVAAQWSFQEYHLWREKEKKRNANHHMDALPNFPDADGNQ